MSRKLEIKNVSKLIKKKRILNKINLTFEFGNIYGIKGINGSGKTVLLKNICGLMIPTEGEFFLDGKDYLKENGFLDSTGIIIEYPGFLDHETGYENLKYLASIKNTISDKEIKNSIERVGLDPEDKRNLKKYSLGMKQRLAIAQAIMESPDILILDEPTNALDEDAYLIIKDIIKEYKDNRKLVLIASHDKTFLEEVCNKIYVIKNGEIKEEISNEKNC